MVVAAVVVAFVGSVAGTMPCTNLGVHVLVQEGQEHLDDKN